MAASFVVVPQWQGSASARAMRLADGALLIRRNLPTAATVVVDIPAEAGDEVGSGVARCSSIVAVRDRLADALARRKAPAVTIGGDCGVELAAVTHADADDVAVLWFDAHPDFNTPDSSPSKAFTGMVLRTLVGEGAQELVPEHPVDPARVVVVGAREFDDAEATALEEHGIRVLASDAPAAAILEAVAATGARRVYVHIDLDVLDPAAIAGLGAPVPFGMSAEQLVAMLREVVSAFPLAGAGITEFAPATPDDEDDLPTILRIIAALTR